MTDSLNQLLKQTICDNWERKAFSDLGRKSYTYGDVARKIAKLHLLLQEAGIKPRDKVALCGRNSANWSVAFLATITYGAIPVPILNDFKAENIHHIVNHSDSRLLWTDETTREAIDPKQMKHLHTILLLTDFSVIHSHRTSLAEYRKKLNETFTRQYPYTFTRDDINYYPDSPGEDAIINYTSGSTGFSKGVVLPYRSLLSNIRFCIDNLGFLRPGDGLISMLPLAHMYGLVIEMMHPFAKGCHIHFLGRTPSPKILLDAFAEVQPKLVIAVPLIIEKIIRTRVLPELKKPLARSMQYIPGATKLLFKHIRKQLLSAFGGNIHQIIIGGAALNSDIEELLHRMKFPYTVGYGMTECGPLIAYAPWQTNPKGSCGQIVARMQARIVPLKEGDNTGELWVRGENIMTGYYKNKEATSAIFKDGWMNTGDLCTFDNNGFLYIRGRNKNMILGASGQNIYPEEIEDKLNNLPYVAESLIVERNGQLAALVYPDFDTVKRKHIDNETLRQQIAENRKTLNNMLPAYSQIAQIIIQQDEFEKTPKKSIKRYLYQQ